MFDYNVKQQADCVAAKIIAIIIKGFYNFCSSVYMLYFRQTPDHPVLTKRCVSAVNVSPCQS